MIIQWKKKKHPTNKNQKQQITSTGIDKQEFQKHKM